MILVIDFLFFTYNNIFVFLNNCSDQLNYFDCFNNNVTNNLNYDNNNNVIIDFHLMFSSFLSVENLFLI